jgi:NhaA family Na+:H+ antiporter
MIYSSIQGFFRLKTAPAILIMAAAILAIFFANTPLGTYYEMLIDVPVEVSIGAFMLSKPLILWINDGLMAIFFFLVGLELKREILKGELKDKKKIALPALGAFGGMVVPALIYVLINKGNPIAMSGWAIPAATDIAFALGVLLLFGTRVPPALKVFLVSLAIFDDIAAIIIIALFYTTSLSTTALLIVLASIGMLFIINRRGVTHFMPYIVLGLIMWAAVLKSGVHATLAGVLLAMFIPIKDPTNPKRSPLIELEHDLQSTVHYWILPVFAFVNSGITFGNIGLDALTHPVTLGTVLGLFIGKQLGIFTMCYIGVRAGLAKLPRGVSWGGLYGVSILCGIGFTMSLFIGSLAFEVTGTWVVEGSLPRAGETISELTRLSTLFDERLGIMIGSLLSAVVGYIVLNKTLKKN